MKRARMVHCTPIRLTAKLILASIIVLAAAACSTPQPSPLPRPTSIPTALTPTLSTVPAYSASGLLADLKADGRVVTIAPDQIDLGFSIQGQRWVVNQASFFVYEFDDSSAASVAAAGVLPDGYNITRSTGSQTTQWHGDWIATPHFFRRGRLIVVYAGDDGTLTETLSQILGAPFAGGYLAMRGPPTPTGNPPTATPDFGGVPHRAAGAGVLISETINFSGPWAIAIYNAWFEIAPDIRVYAGNAADPEQGAVALLVPRDDIYRPEVYLTPLRVGGVQIIDAAGERLVLQSLDQAHTFYFDVPTRRFVDSLSATILAPTVTPFPTFTPAPLLPFFPSPTSGPPPTAYPNPAPTLAVTNYTPPSPILLATATPTAVVTAQLTITHLVSPYSQQPLPSPAEGSLAVLGLSFADPLHGWAIASAYDPAASIAWTTVLTTTDGGQHWGLIPAPNAVAFAVDAAPALPVLNQIAFTSQLEGTLSGTRRFVTHDGGLSWHDAGPVSADPAPINLGTGRYRLQTRNCAPTGFSDGNRCEYRLWQSPDGNNWGPTPVAVQAVTASLAQASARVAWLVYYAQVSDGSQVAGHMMRTSNGGHTWQSLPDLPSPELSGFSGYWFFPVSETDIWLVAGDAGAGPNGGKAILTSRDGGQSWELRARVRIDGSDRVGDICSGCGFLRNFTPVTARTAFMGLGRGGLLGTKDGGRTWYEAIPYNLVNPADGVAGPAYFTDPLHGWVISQVGIFRTTDGGDHWTFASAPGLPGLPGRVFTPAPPYPTPGPPPTQHSYRGPPGVTPLPTPTLYTYPGPPDATPPPVAYP